MVSDRLLLCEDAGTEEARLMQAGLTRGVPPPAGGVLPAVQLLPACQPRKGGHGHARPGPGLTSGLSTSPPRRAAAAGFEFPRFVAAAPQHDGAPREQNDASYSPRR